MHQNTISSKYYFDASHFRPCVGLEMEKRIFWEKSDNANGFGMVVRKENIEEFIKQMEEQIEK